MISQQMDSWQTVSLTSCRLCPRNCGVDRMAGQVGYCGGGAHARVAKVMLHHWEEPCISGSDTDTRGSGAVFFAHCSLGCVYCQNRDISGRCSTVGTDKTTEELAQIFLDLQDKGAYNLNLVTPTHYAAQIAEALRSAKKAGLTLPVVWNTGGYESAAVLAALDGLVDVYLTDWKYASADVATTLSHSADYPERAEEAFREMVRQVGGVTFDGQGMLTRGVILRHLCLPGYRTDSIAVLRRAAAVLDEAGLPISTIRLSLMRQYTPAFVDDRDDLPRSLHRRVTTFEYESVLAEAVRLGFDGYTQEKDSAVTGYTPAFL